MPSFRSEGSGNATPAPGQASPAGYAFGPFLLDTRSNRLSCNNAPVAMSARQLAVLHALVAANGRVVSKDHLIEVGWHRAVSDSSLEKLVAAIRKGLAPGERGRYISTASGEGYQIVVSITRVEAPRIDVDVFALLAPDRIWGEGLAALESLGHQPLTIARIGVERLVADYPVEPRFRIGLALICALLYDSTRADPQPDTLTLDRAKVEAHEACRLDPHHAEPSATLAFVLQRTGDQENALAAIRRATRMDPTNWLHHSRHAMIAWGQESISAASETLRLNPGLAIPHYFIARVWVARKRPDEAERHVDAGIALMRATSSAPPRYTAVGLYLLKGLLCLPRADTAGAIAAFDQEIEHDRLSGHLYGRESSANAWYGKGVACLLLGDLVAARAAFREALLRIAHHPTALAGLEIVDRRERAQSVGPDSAKPSSPQAPKPKDEPSKPLSLVFEHAMARAALLVDAGDVYGAVKIVEAALSVAPPDNTGWTLPLDPLLKVWENPGAWATVLATLYSRAM